MAAPRLHDADLRRRLLARAGQVVATAGVSALTMRSLAALEGTSTTAVYSLFGGKQELLGALFGEAFASFGAAQAAAPTSPDLLTDLRALGWAYWDWASEHPNLYAVMFGGALGDFDPGPHLVEQSLTSRTPLTQLTRRGVEDGLFVGDPETIALAIWSAVHGVVSLTLLGCPPPQLAEQLAARRDVYELTLRAIVAGLRAERATATTG